LIGHQIRVDLDLPYEKEDQARLFMEVQKFDFTDFLALLMGSSLRNDYRSLLSFRMDIQSETNDIFAATGVARVDDLYLARGEHFLRNNKPMFVYFEKGLANLRDFNIKGYQSEIFATGENFSPSKLQVNLGGSIDLRLLQLFTPFLDDVSGPVKGQIRLSGSLQNPEVYGNLDLNEVAVRIKGFPPLFDHINSHLEFSQKKIIIESIRGSLAGGTVVGDGGITINGLKDVQVDVKAQLRNLQMEVPENIQSSGSADIVFSGNWFPYTLSGSYRVSQAFIDKDFSGDSNENNVRQSIYLPKNLAGTTFDPVVLDLQVFLDKKVEIRNPQMSGFLAGQLQIKGPPHNPIILGSIKTLPQAQLFFRDKIFDVQSGLVKFNDPVELNPELYFTARSIVDKYEINLLLQGKSKSPQLSLTSQPPLEEQDIISLLALGVTTQKLDSQIESSQQAAQTGYQLGTAIISANPLNKEIKQSLGVDVKFSSGFDDTKNVALPRVTVSKDIIPRKLTASATSSFSENQQYDVRFQYLLNERLSTVVTYEKSEGQDGSAATGTNQSNISIFGLDLEYKVEFK
jgi:translocation and assembly module TamB